MNKQPAFLLLAFALCAPPAQAEIYKVVGADGKVSYTDKNPQPTATQTEKLKVQPSSGAASASSPNASARKVTLLSAQWCGACQQAKAYMNSRNIAFVEWDIDQSDYARTKIKALGAKGVPVILVGQQTMVGFSPEQLDAMLKNAGAI